MNTYIILFLIILFFDCCTMEPKNDLDDTYNYKLDNLNDLEEEIKVISEDGLTTLSIFYDYIDNEKKIFSIKCYNEKEFFNFVGIYKDGIDEEILDNALDKNNPKIPNGYYKCYYSENLDCEGYILDNKEHGIHKFYYIYPAVKREINYHYGTIINEIYYDIDGNEIEAFIPG